MLRTIIGSLLKPFFEKDKALFLCYCDMGFGNMDPIIKGFPNRTYNMGIREQATVSIAAGMASQGLLPIVYSMPNFLAFRALEQIRNDIVLQELPVKIIATGCNDYFKHLGESHCCGETDKTIMRLIGMPVYDTLNTKREEAVFNGFMASQYGYLRI